jgi:hypothetical protein
MKEPDESCYARYRAIREGNSFFESIPKKYSTIASGATTIGRAGRAPDDIIRISYYMMIQGRTIYLSLYSKTCLSTIASGATPIGSTGRAPDEILKCIKKVEKVNEDLDNKNHYHWEGVYIIQG